MPCPCFWKKCSPPMPSGQRTIASGGAQARQCVIGDRFPVFRQVALGDPRPSSRSGASDSMSPTVTPVRCGARAARCGGAFGTAQGEPRFAARGSPRRVRIAVLRSASGPAGPRTTSDAALSSRGQDRSPAARDRTGPRRRIGSRPPAPAAPNGSIFGNGSPPRSEPSADRRQFVQSRSLSRSSSRRKIPCPRHRRSAAFLCGS